MPDGMLLEHMSDDDQRALYAQLAYKFSRSSAHETLTQHEQDYWDALNDVLNISARKRQPFEVFVKARGIGGRAGFAEKAEDSIALIKSGTQGTLRRAQQSAILRLALRFLAEDLEAIGIPKTVSALCAQQYRLRTAVEARFPGYIAAKLLHLVAPLILA